MKTLKAIGKYFLNILTVLAIDIFALCTAIFAPKHLSEILTDAEPKKSKKKK